MALDRPLDDIRVQAANVADSTSTVSKYNIFLIFMFTACQGKTTLSSPTYVKTYTRQQRRVYDERGRKTESFTQAAPNELKLGEGG